MIVMQVTNHARSAMLHFYTPNIAIPPADRAVKSFFVSFPPLTHYPVITIKIV